MRPPKALRSVSHKCRSSHIARTAIPIAVRQMTIVVARLVNHILGDAPRALAVDGRPA